jgi:ribulose-5-phosphate 4-epimerase/fuculose-1-phosphate aldolase
MRAEEDQRVRVAVDAALRVLSVGGIDDPLPSAVTVRLADRDRFIAAPIGIPWAVVQPAELVAGSADALLSGEAGAINIPAVNNNLDVLKRNSEIAAVFHAHPPASVLLGVCGEVLVPFCQEACRFFEDQSIVNDRFEFDDAERPAWLAESIGRGKVLLIRNHGIMTQGASVEEAAAWLLQYERLADMQLRLTTRLNALPLIPDAAARMFKKTNGSPEAGRAWFFAKLTELQGEL